MQTLEPLIRHDRVPNAEEQAVIVSAVSYLNLKAKTRYKESRQTARTILARLRSGFTLADLKKAVDSRVAAWINDPRMKQYIRPITVWGPNMESYINVPEDPNPNRPRL